MRRLLLALLLLPCLATPALAQAPSTMSYQGVLTDNAGNLVPDGNYALTFRLYDVAAAGAALWTEAIAVVPVQKGGFGVTLGLITPINLAFDRKYYLGVQVGADPELAPRVELASSPYAMGLRLPFSHSLASNSALLSLRNQGFGPAIRADGRLEVGSSTLSGEFELFRSGSSQSVLRMAVSPIGGNLYLPGTNGGSAQVLSPDANGTGGFFATYRDLSNFGFTVDGNYDATNEPRVTVSGSARSAVFDMGESGDPAVTLPSGSISALEQGNEPGVASATNAGSLTLDGTIETVLVRTITCPAAGYVLVIGSMEARGTHTTGASSNLNLGVSDNPSAFPANQEIDLIVPGVLPTANYYFPTAVHGLFTVAAGANTFYLLGQEVTGSWTASDAQLTLVYLPTAYGTVTSSEPQSVTGTGNDQARAPSRALTSTDILAEQAEALRFQQARLEREMAEMSTRFEQLQSELAGATALQAAVARSAERPTHAAPAAAGDRK